jgi:hypothetical protein
MTWETVLKDRSRLIDILISNQVEIFEPIIDFQLRFGGLIYYTGFEPICWGIHHLNPSGEFKYSGEEIINFIHEGENPEFSPLCADTLCQISWTIDDKGAIFEDFDLLTNSFEKVIEDYALREELITENITEIFKRNIFDKELKSVISNFDKIEPILELQEPGIKWYKIGDD